MTEDLDALRQQYLQCLNALARELPIAVPTDATGIISVYVRALLARLDAQQQDLDTVLRAMRGDHRYMEALAGQELQRRLDAVTAYAQHGNTCAKWGRYPYVFHDEITCSCGLAAVLTGDGKTHD